MNHSSADNMKLLGIAASSTNNASGNKGVKFAPGDRYYDSKEWYELSKSDKEKVIKARSNRNRVKKSTKSGGHYKSGGGRNNGHGKWKSNIAMPEKEGRNQKRQLSVFKTAAKPG